MAQATILDTNKIEFSPSDPTEDGQMVYTSATIVEIEDCDATTNWSVLVGGTGTISLDQTKQVEGTGCIRVISVNPTDVTVKATFGAKDLTGCKSIELYLQRNNLVDDDMTLYLGEAAYDENSQAIVATKANDWEKIIWDISGIANADKNATTMFSIKFTNLYAASGAVYIDYIVAYGDESVKIKLPSGVKTFTLT